MKLISVFIFILITNLNCNSQNLNEIFKSIYQKKQIIDKDLNDSITIKEVDHYNCNEKIGFNNLIDSNIIIGVKKRICQNEWIPFFYIYLKNRKELQLLLTYSEISDALNIFDIGLQNISDVFIYDSTNCLKYHFSIPSIEPQSYKLRKFGLENDSLQIINFKAVSECVIEELPNYYKHYIPINTKIDNMTLKEYLNLIDKLKLEID